MKCKKQHLPLFSCDQNIKQDHDRNQEKGLLQKTKFLDSTTTLLK